MVNTSRPIVALYGGSFDPPHRGHQQIVDRLIALPYLDKIIVTPTWLNPFKTHSKASAHQRLTWCRVLFDHPKVVVDSGEVDSGHSVYTAHTVARLNRDYDVAYIVIGSDNLSAIEKWYDFEALNQTITWLIFDRAGYSAGHNPLKNYCYFDLDVPISSREIRTDPSPENIDEKIINSVKETYTKGTP